MGQSSTDASRDTPVPPSLTPETATPLSHLTRMLTDLLEIHLEKPSILRSVYALWATDPENVKPSEVRNFALQTACAIAARGALLQSGGSIAPLPHPAQRWHNAARHLSPQLFGLTVFDWWLPFCETPQLSAAIEGVIAAAADPEASDLGPDPAGTLYMTCVEAGTRKGLGEFYTPAGITNFLLDEVGYQGSGTRQRLLDPACGSGAFLAPALERRLAAGMSLSPIPPDIRSPQGPYSENLSAFLAACSLIGVDLHPYACLAAKVRLAIRLCCELPMAQQARALQYLPIFWGDFLLQPPQHADRFSLTLVGPQWDRQVIDLPLPEPALYPGEGQDLSRGYIQELQQVASTLIPKPGGNRAGDGNMVGPRGKYLDQLSQHYNKTLDQHVDEFAHPTADPTLTSLRSWFRQLVGAIARDTLMVAGLCAHVPMDAVVGNPPYVRAARVPAERRRAYRRVSETAQGAFDLTVPFIEHGVTRLRPGGKLAYISTDKYMVADYGKTLRTWLLQKCRIDAIVDLTRARAFGVRLVSAALLIATRTDAESAALPTHPVRIASLPGAEEADFQALGRFLGLPVDDSPRQADPHIAVHTIAQGKLGAGPRARFEIHGNSRRHQLVARLTENADPLAQVGPVRGGIMGFDYHALAPYLADSPQGDGAGWWLITPTHILPMRIDASRSVRLLRRWQQAPFLRADCPVLGTTLPGFFAAAKVVIRGLGKRLTAAYDAEGLALSVAVFAVQPTRICPLLLTGLLNSAVLDFYSRVRLHGARIPRGSWRFPRSFLEELPIRMPLEGAANPWIRATAATLVAGNQAATPPDPGVWADLQAKGDRLELREHTVISWRDMVKQAPSRGSEQIPSPHPKQIQSLEPEQMMQGLRDAVLTEAIGMAVRQRSRKAVDTLANTWYGLKDTERQLVESTLAQYDGAAPP